MIFKNLNLVKDVEDNYEKIVINMELNPFKYIMQSYDTKIGEMTSEIEKYFSLSLELKRYKLIEYKESVDTVKNLQEKIFTPYIDERSLPILGKSIDINNKYLINKLPTRNNNRSGSEKDDLNEIFATNEDDDIMNSINMSTTLRKLTNDIMTNKIDTDRKLQKEAQKLINTVDEFMNSIKENETNRRIDSVDKKINIKSKNDAKLEKTKLQPNATNFLNHYEKNLNSIMTSQLSPKVHKTDSQLVSEEILSIKNNYTNQQFQDTKQSTNTSRDMVNTGEVSTSYNKHYSKLSDRTNHYQEIRDSDNNISRKAYNENIYENLPEDILAVTELSSKLEIKNPQNLDSDLNSKTESQIQKNRKIKDYNNENPSDENNSQKE